jgi:stage II sporulation protein R
MKKVIVILFVIVISILYIKKSSSQVLIPDNAIRFRIIASSNSFKDQQEKLEIKKDIEPILASINANTLEDTRTSIKESIPKIEKEVSNYTQDYKINFGSNYFPEKTYKNVTYPAGDYESLVITLGDGKGDNWWCVLFPPLCLLEAKEDSIDDVTYSLYIKDVLDKYM